LTTTAATATLLQSGLASSAILWATLRLLGDPQVRRAVAVDATCGCRRVGLATAKMQGEIL
jgi:hypothetical protein